MKNRKLAFVVDLDRCIGCKGCQIACHMENGTALGVNRIQVRQVGPFGVFPDLEMYFLPAMCQQCEDPSCVRVCPTDIRRVSDRECIQCGRCAQACPEHAIRFSASGIILPKNEVAKVAGTKPQER